MLHQSSRTHLFLILLMAGATLLWTTGCGSDNVEATSDSMTEQGPAPLVIDESGDGQTFDVIEGQQVVVHLPGNPTTGYEWMVASTDRTFGYPVQETYLSESEQDVVGSGGVFEFVWNTSGPLPMGGLHTVVLEYRRSWEPEAIDTFTFSVNIISDTPAPSDVLVIEQSGEGQSFDVVEGRDVLVRLAGNPTTGYEWSVASTDRTFGYPVSEEYIPSDGGTGSGGVYEMLWKTASPLSLVGTHTVVLEYRRSWEPEAIDTFTFSVNILPAEQ